ncbi:H-NS histone family protein [Bradyrhizobium sp. STM 3843]|uniref:H-NS histone family protein n=1 Tax=unclassified Bradyrhizobium TaxID=2631580 RepID=UPI0002D81143|nr:H-NS histone family protein [Bradyrhizobium sp. STM 3843]
MKSYNLKSMSVDQLWDLHERLVAELGRKIAAEKAMLEERLSQLGSVKRHTAASNQIGAVSRHMPARDTKRPYPKVLPKYRNPKNPDETWAGRGKQPRWLVAQLRSGRKLEEFRIKGP